MNILDQYWKKATSTEQVEDTFWREWSSQLPGIDGVSIVSGHANVFFDDLTHPLGPNICFIAVKI